MSAKQRGRPVTAVSFPQDLADDMYKWTSDPGITGTSRSFKQLAEYARVSEGLIKKVLYTRQDDGSRIRVNSDIIQRISNIVRPSLAITHIEEVDHSIRAVADLAYRFHLQGKPIEAHQFIDASLMAAIGLCSDKDHAGILGTQAWLTYFDGHFDLANERAKNLLAFCNRIGYDFLRADTLCLQGLIAIEQRQPEKAAGAFFESLSIYKREHNLPRMAAQIWNRAFLAETQRDFAGAHFLYKQALELYPLGNDEEDAYSIEQYVCIAVACEVPEMAARLYGLAKNMRDTVKLDRCGWEADQYNQTIDTLIDKLGREAFDQLRTAGKLFAAEEAAFEVIKFFDKRLATRLYMPPYELKKFLKA
jgi:tetratricopeptide (TPR) repeat protein